MHTGKMPLKQKLDSCLSARYLRICKNTAVLKGYQSIKLCIVFDMKQSLKRKARIVARGYMTDIQVLPFFRVYVLFVYLRN